jgi:tRNA(Arg) A34 adenosine deaminase TadA
MSSKKFMRVAIKKAEEGIRKGQAPFGACLVKNGRIICCAHNTVWKNSDITAHAEINVIRSACKKLRTIDLSGCVIYSTCEPCPMCFGACHWAGLSRIVYGARIKDAEKIGFSELKISNRKMKEMSRSPLAVVGGLLRRENLRLFTLWSKRKDKQIY